MALWGSGAIGLSLHRGSLALALHMRPWGGSSSPCVLVQREQLRVDRCFGASLKARSSPPFGRGAGRRVTVSRAGRPSELPPSEPSAEHALGPGDILSPRASLRCRLVSRGASCAQLMLPAGAVPAVIHRV